MADGEATRELYRSRGMSGPVQLRLAAPTVDGAPPCHVTIWEVQRKISEGDRPSPLLGDVHEVFRSSSDRADFCCLQRASRGARHNRLIAQSTQHF